MRDNRWQWIGGTTLLLSLIALTGCTSAKPTYLADGARGYVVSCSGWLSDWSDCLRRAGRVCRTAGYDVSYSDDIDHKMLVACRQPATSGR
jgi:hypothetical protein